ncbi:hypothetical protein P4637_08940 [Halalkalibacterium halodurans]|uniref:BH2890 protein n=1 Tax=Halalkalibacterium halodurans (strain ATCC BAA-125 / DSM 18197 / FERM 7344 / JCM 9153 / C-125) TaxID=272558 RepID=Q9K8W2_HALH5|nr:hypothetical protein [Halalkalibacterium halodurans]MED4081629.1 hypothetical protein [Halalkalibacterium halodurans]MED4084959.1 hypothetical protein [Halalkalibacterium halodurans]MED4104154.1 hypothetical protein [Halalkalibacterium halodurans]MED4110528.1 hypothetical protein [Halalkalibacterium halodurans]MED4148466.1 hypothetical protein [Halalkalibacterium halodurans]
MNVKEAIFGIIIFAIITISTYILFHNVLLFSDGFSVVIALVCGFLVERLFMKWRHAK